MINNTKVISIGNIVLGGAGKTPHTIEIANQFVKDGKKTAILSLGYKGKLGYQLNVISDGNKIFYKPPLAGDEPYMMATQCPNVAIITGKSRQLSLDYAVKNFGTNIAILDDGFQHNKIKKDVEILLLDYKNPISTGFIFPFGYLRQMPQAIKKADIIIFTRSSKDIIPEKTKRYIDTPHIFFSKTKTENIVFQNNIYNKDDLKGANVFAYSAVANNKSFYNSLIELGTNVTFFKGFRDHNLPPIRFIENLIENSHKNNIDFIVTTQKDFVKLPEKYQSYFSYLKMDIDIINRQLFFDTLNNMIKKT